MRRLWTLIAVLVVPWSQAGCGGDAGTRGTDAALADAAETDAALPDADGMDTAVADAGGADSGGTDGGPAMDAAGLDGGVDAAGDASSVGLDGSVDATRDVRTVSSVPDYLIVTADDLIGSATRYRVFRQASGYNVDVTTVGEIVGEAADATTASARIRDHVRARYQARDSTRPMYLLLLGDAQATWPGDGSGVPSGSWLDTSTGSPVVSDNVFADVDGDDVPDLAVGRITADSDAEVDLVRGKVAAYEANRDLGVWDRRLSIFASTSGMGDLVDTAIEGLVYDITEAIPYAYDVTMTYARQSSPYVYVPEQFSSQVYRRINEGALLVAYVGHGSHNGFASLDWNGTSYPILDTSQLDRLVVTHRSPILVFVACATGAFAGEESISERILALPEAPTAIFSSTQDSHPYANAMFIHEVAQAFTVDRAGTVGDAFVLAKRRLLQGTDTVRLRIEAVAALLVNASAKEALKRSHLHMYTLFGDPAMAVSYMGTAAVTVTPAEAHVGATLNVTATFPALASAGQAIVTLESTRRTVLGPIATVPADGDANRDAVIVENYQNANDKVAAEITLPVAGSSLSATLAVPSSLPPGSYVVKVFVADGEGDAGGSTPLTVTARASSPRRDGRAEPRSYRR
jgi:hypothetical protein